MFKPRKNFWGCYTGLPVRATIKYDNPEFIESLLLMGKAEAGRLKDGSIFDTTLKQAPGQGRDYVGPAERRGRGNFVMPKGGVAMWRP